MQKIEINLAKRKQGEKKGRSGRVILIVVLVLFAAALIAGVLSYL